MSIKVNSQEAVLPLLDNGSFSRKSNNLKRLACTVLSYDIKHHEHTEDAQLGDFTNDYK